MSTRIHVRSAGVALIACFTLSLSAQEAAPPATAAAAPAATPAPPPSAPAKLGAAELEKLLMPIALYPDALIATMLPASVYPLEIVQAARFLTDTNNVSKIDEQPWDPMVKAIAKIPAALKKMNDDLQWTIQLGEVFLNQDKDVMDMIQALRMKAQKAGTLQTTPQQTVIVTNTVVEKTVEQQVVVVTNTVVQIQPSSPDVVYVPSYPPTVYYPPPAYVYDPYAPLITFGVGMAMGAIIANNCDWDNGGCWGGGDVDVDVNRNVNIDNSRGDTTINRGSGNRPTQQGNRGQKWQPDQNRVRSSGSPGAAKSMEARGWGSGSGGATAGTRPGGGGASAGTRPAAGGARPSTQPVGGRGTGPTASTRPTTPSGAGAGAGVGDRSAAAAKPATRSPGATQYPGGSSAGDRSRETPSASQRSSPGQGGGSSAFGSGRSGGGGGGGGFSDARASQRGAASRGGGGGGGGGGRGGGGGGRGGGGGGRGR